MLTQIPYSLDELLASIQFIRRRVKAGRSWLRVLLFGDTDEGSGDRPPDEFAEGPGAFLTDMWSGGVNLPWNLALAALVGLWLMFTRLTLGAEGAMANADHLVGALSLTVISLAAAEVARPLRFLLVPLGGTLLLTPFVYQADVTQMVVSILCGVALIALSIRRGPIRGRYGSWQSWIR
jgi:hypothetical protein